MLRTLPLVSLLAAGCSEQSPASHQSAGVDLATECSLSARALDTLHQPANWSIFGPEHVVTISAAAPMYQGEIAALVTLSHDGKQRMLRYTKNNVGKLVAFFCGDVEISKAHITAPVDATFRVNFPEDWDT